jgi:hypothetical protein
MTVVVLRLEGHRWWCACGSPIPWTVDIHSPHTSQHLVDPYTLTHVLHGLIFYAIFHVLGVPLRLDSRMSLAVAIEALWEVAENSPAVIERYRQTTIALGYFGDSVLNSLGDILACGIGFFLAARWPVRWSIALFLAFEMGLLLVYRDNLLLNVVMLIYPMEGIKAWQMRG